MRSSGKTEKLGSNSASKEPEGGANYGCLAANVASGMTRCPSPGGMRRGAVARYVMARSFNRHASALG